MAHLGAVFRDVLFFWKISHEELPQQGCIEQAAQMGGFAGVLELAQRLPLSDTASQSNAKARISDPGALSAPNRAQVCVGRQYGFSQRFQLEMMFEDRRALGPSNINLRKRVRGKHERLMTSRCENEGF